MEVDGILYTETECQILIRIALKEKQRQKNKSAFSRTKKRTNPVVYKLYVDFNVNDEGTYWCYVGRTQYIQERLKQHFSKSNNCVSSILVNKYGKDKIKYEILEECTIENQYDREKYWINSTYCVNKAENTSKKELVVSDGCMYVHIISDNKTTAVDGEECTEDYIIDLMREGKRFVLLKNKTGIKIPTL